MDQGTATSKWAREPSSDEEETQRRKKREKRFKKSRDSPFREGSGTPSSASGRTPREPDLSKDSSLRYETSARSVSAEPVGISEDSRARSSGSPIRESTPNTSIHTIEYRITVPEAPQHPVLTGCRSVENYEKLNRISEGTYGVVYRARDRLTGEIVALKKLKLDQEKNGFPITSLREIYTLLLAKHPHIVNVREIVVGDKLTQ
jgi:cell division cycle 2-like protein